MTLFEGLQLVLQYGLIAVLLGLWLLERSERIDAQKETARISASSLAAINEMRSLVGQLSIVFNSLHANNPIRRSRRD